MAKSMLIPRRRWSVISLASAWLSLISSGCEDDNTFVCAEINCAEFDPLPVDAAAPGTCEVAFTAPFDGQSDVRLVGSDDADGDECGAEFTARVGVASSAGRVNLFVNDTPLGSRPVDGPTTEILAVLGNRGDTPNSLRVEATTENGETCSATFEADVFVDCVGPSCTLQSPLSTSRGFLNQSHDQAANPGLQTDVVVRTGAQNAGETVGLEIDGVAQPDAVGVASGSDSLATFPNLTLEEGQRVVQAECRDSDGAVARSTPAVWHVDITPCSVDLLTVAGGSNPITEASDQDANPSNGLQVLVTGELVGEDCRTLRAGPCDQNGIDYDISASSGGAFSAVVTIASASTSFDLCGRIIDEADNASAPDQLGVTVRLESPVVAFAAPADGAVFNVASGCTPSVSVNCSEIGATVELSIDGTAQPTATCEAPGSASFSVALPTKNDGAPTLLSARQSAAGFPDATASVNVISDCETPLPTISAPICGSELIIPDDDVSSEAPGLQVDVTVQNDGVPAATLTVTRGAASEESSTTGNAVSTTFAAANLGDPGSVTLRACVTDPAGNQGCSPDCALTVVAAPAIAITSPVTGSTLSTANTADCNAGASGLDATISGTTDAPDGSPVQVTFNSGPPLATTVNAGTWSVCLATPDGENHTLTASVVSSADNLTGTATATFSVDTAVPSTPILRPNFAVTGRRQGTGELSWQSVLDSGGGPLATYRLRCAATDITSEPTWATATDIPVNLTPQDVAGRTETFGVSGFKTGTTRFCVVRGEDAGGNLTPISAGLSVTANVPFLSKTLTVADDSNAPASIPRVSIEPLGDINGDGAADLAYGGSQRQVQVFFGGASFGSAGAESPDFEITFGGTAINTVGFGSEIAGLGDINGDGISDFAASAPNVNAVFVFFGRASNTWTNIDVDADAADGCEADVCIIGANLGGTSGGFFGWDVSSANFDGAGPNDVVIGARTANTSGQAFIVLGGTQLSASGTTVTVDAADLAGGPDGFIVSPPAGRIQFAFSVGSVDGNVLIGAVGQGGASPIVGAVYVLPSRATPTASGGLVTLTTPDLIEIETGPGANFGASVRGIGDYDGDGFSDFAAGENFTAAGGRGNVTLYRGSASGFSAGSALTFTNNLTPTVDDNYGTFIGASLRAGLGLLGDLDGDDLADLVAGATVPDTPAGSRGSAQLFYGAQGAGARTRSTADFSFTSTLASGQVVPNFVGDIDDDGFNDLIILDSGAQANVVFLLH